MFNRLDPKVKDSLDLITAQMSEIERKHHEWFAEAEEATVTELPHWCELVAAS